MATATRTTRAAPAVPARGASRRPLLAVLGAVGAFLAVTAWWLAADSSVLDFDSGRHVFNTWAMHDALGRGDLLAPLTQDNINHYPPALYLVGSLGMAIGGWQSVDSAMAAMNLVFVPLLAFGCFTAARIAYGDLAGVLAALFALGAPMVVSTFHLYMLDVPQAAAVAATVGLVLASRRFSRPGVSALAGLAGALAMLLKPTSAIALVGFVAVVLLRGGWRRPAGLAAFFGVGALLAAPWYLVHLSDIRGLTGGFAAAPASGGGGVNSVSHIRPERYSEENLFWYGWNLLNLQLWLPLFLAFVAGLVVAVVRFVRTRDPADPTPELLVGGLVAYLGLTYLSLKDPRYTLPALVYVAVLGVAWVPSLRGRARPLAAGAVAVVAAVNLVGISLGAGREVRIGTGAPTMLNERSARVYSPGGYLRSAPRDDSDVLAVMRAVRADGARRIELDPGGDLTFSINGLRVLARIAGLQQPPAFDAASVAPDVPFLFRHPVPPGGPEPCGRVDDGRGVYLHRGGGNVAIPFEAYRLYCPR